MRKNRGLNIDRYPADEIEKDISALFKLDPALVANSRKFFTTRSRSYP